MQPYILNTYVYAYIHTCTYALILCLGDVLENTWVPKCS